MCRAVKSFVVGKTAITPLCNVKSKNIQHLFVTNPTFNTFNFNVIWRALHFTILVNVTCKNIRVKIEALNLSKSYSKDYMFETYNGCSNCSVSAVVIVTWWVILFPCIWVCLILMRFTTWIKNGKSIMIIMVISNTITLQFPGNKG